MKCHISYIRLEPNTIVGEELVVTYRYSTFDVQQMDAFEKTIRETIGSGITAEYGERETDDQTGTGDKGT